MCKKWTALFSAIGMLLLILDTKSAFRGASEGIQLCIQTLIPSLFPFFVLSSLLTGSLSGPFLRPLCRIFSITETAQSALVVGALGGYPTGAQTVMQLYYDGRIDQTQATRLISFCNNAGPSFFFGIVASKFSTPWMSWALWGIHLFSAALVAFLDKQKLQTDETEVAYASVSLPLAVQRSIRAIASVCGWVLLFRIIVGFLDRWLLWLLPRSVRVCLIGLMELTNGCCELEYIVDESVRFVLASAMLSFGGLCVTLQTMSVTNGFGMKAYLRGKLLQTFFSILLSLAMIGAISATFLLALTAIIIRELKKSSRNPRFIGV